MDWRVLTNWDANPEGAERLSTTPWQRLSTEWIERVEGPELSAVEWASYVLTISSPFSIGYPQGHSPVIYIGEGFAHLRFKEHIDKKLLPMVQTFRGAKFDFWLLNCESKDQVVATEAKMLTYFEETFGERPLFNKRSEKGNGTAPHRDWFAPLDKRRIGKREWALKRLGK